VDLPEQVEAIISTVSERLMLKTGTG
jgi:hypothetical protein